MQAARLLATTNRKLRDYNMRYLCHHWKLIFHRERWSVCSKLTRNDDVTTNISGAMITVAELFNKAGAKFDVYQVVYDDGSCCGHGVNIGLAQ